MLLDPSISKIPTNYPHTPSQLYPNYNRKLLAIVKTILEISGTRSSKQGSHTGKYYDPVVSLIAEDLETLERYYNRRGRVEERRVGRLAAAGTGEWNYSRRLHRLSFVSWSVVVATLPARPALRARFESANRSSHRSREL